MKKSIAFVLFVSILLAACGTTDPAVSSPTPEPPLADTPTPYRLPPTWTSIPTLAVTATSSPTAGPTRTSVAAALTLSAQPPAPPPAGAPNPENQAGPTNEAVQPPAGTASPYDSLRLTATAEALLHACDSPPGQPVFTAQSGWQGWCRLAGSSAGEGEFDYQFLYPAEWSLLPAGNGSATLSFTIPGHDTVGLFMAIHGAFPYPLREVLDRAMVCDEPGACRPVIPMGETITSQRFTRLGDRDLLVVDSRGTGPQGEYQNIRRYFVIISYEIAHPGSGGRLFVLELRDPVDGIARIGPQVETLIYSLAPSFTSQVDAFFNCEGPQHSRLIGSQAAFLSLDPPITTRVRLAPGAASAEVGQLEPGEILALWEGPICQGGYIWWKVLSQSDGTFGWTAEGDASLYWLVPCAHLEGCSP